MYENMIGTTLATQPMMQCRLNQTEERTVDSYVSTNQPINQSVVSTIKSGSVVTESNEFEIAFSHISKTLVF